MEQYLQGLTTEAVNADTRCIDQCSAREIVELMNREDRKVALAVEKELDKIALAVERIAESFQEAGRLIYIGAGTSGRLGVLDASECPPTFGTHASMVQGYIAGGDIALRNAVEGCEDSEEAGRSVMEECLITQKDVVVGISASGSAAFVLSALKAAKEKGAVTIGICNNDESPFRILCDICIAPVVGPEVIMGSTRLKAGTAQKMVLNMLTTGAMIQIGKVYGNLMVDLHVSNRKLNDRALRMICKACDCPEEEAKEQLEKANGRVKPAILMQKTKLEYEVAVKLLTSCNGVLSQAIRAANGGHDGTEWN